MRCQTGLVAVKGISLGRPDLTLRIPGWTLWACRQ
jgi:hypothetical protein